MAFVVVVVRNPFLLPRSLVIRKEWIFGLSECKTMNFGVNRNQDHTIYYSSDANSTADFTVAKKTTFDDEIEAARQENALYIARIYRFFETREEAEEWRKQHRSKYPAIYNEARLTELPLPMQPTQQCDASDDVVDQLSTSVDRISMGDAGTNSPVRDPKAEINDKTAEAVIPIRVATNVDDAHDTVVISDDEDDGAHGGADRENQPVPSNSIEPRSVWVPLPISCKLEYDNLSGFIPFVAGEYGERKYIYRLKEFPIKSYMLELIADLNADKKDDKIFLMYLLIAFIGVDHVKSGFIDADAIKLIKEFFSMRIQGHDGRMSNFDAHITDGIDEIRLTR